MSCLRAKSAADLQNSSAGFRGGILSGPLPTAGVPELPLPPAEAVRTGRFERVPLLIGSTHDEVWGWARSFATATPAQYEKSLEYLFGNRAQLAQQVAKYQPKTFLYRFDARSPSAPPARAPSSARAPRTRPGRRSGRACPTSVRWSSSSAGVRR